ncbi:MAG: hypothetical protein EA370_15865 [Wenzhouxiangella sp.]|nr:MAG: hypothetical protein EA370_15865 [Wenzhouxiangella sp.]
MKADLTRLCLLILIMTSAQAMAQEDTNEHFDITGWIDGEPASWILQADRINPSAVFSTPAPGTHQFRIHAYQDERFRREGSLYLELIIQGDTVQAVDVQLFPFGPRYPRFSFGSDHGTGQLTLEALEVEPRTARLSARFAGQLYYHQSPNTRPIPHRTRPIRIQIDLTAYRD